MKKKIGRFLTTFITLMIIIFAVTFITKISVDALIFNQKTLSFSYIYFEVIAIVLSSLILTFFFQINRITLLIQILVTYIIITVDIYILGFISGWFSFKNILFVIISLSINVIGVMIFSIAVFIRKNIQQEKLNKELELYKEKETYEK